jgi:hypothetical protein
MCELHLSEPEPCQACINGSPPDLGVSVVEETKTVERIS